MSSSVVRKYTVNYFKSSVAESALQGWHSAIRKLRREGIRIYIVKETILAAFALPYGLGALSFSRAPCRHTDGLKPSSMLAIRQTQLRFVRFGTANAVA